MVQPAASAGAIFQAAIRKGSSTDDLTDYADGFAQDNRQVFGVKLGGGAFFAADDAGEITEMVGSQRDVGGAGFADRFTVVQRFLQGEQFQVFVNHIGDFVQNGRALAVVVLRHVLNASCAAATAASTSASDASVNLANSSPLAGL